MQVVTKDTLPETSKESILYKGPSGSRKTPNAFSWPTPIYGAYFDANRKNVDAMIREGRDITLFIPESFAEFDREFITKAYHREFECQTLVVDTIDFAAAMLMGEIQGSKARMVMQDWGKLLSDLRQAVFRLTSCTKEIEGKPSYNVVFTSHLMDVTNDDGVLLKTVPKLSGQFKDEIEDYFDTVLICQAKRTNVIVAGKSVAQKEFICHSIPPTDQQTAKGMGLPPTVDGMYSSLRKAWDAKDV